MQEAPTGFDDSPIGPFRHTILFRRVWGGGFKTDSFAGEPTLEYVAGELSSIVGPKSVDQPASFAAKHAHVFLEGISYFRFLLQKVDTAPSAVVVGEEYEES
jgi:hypothetical protein